MINETLARPFSPQAGESDTLRRARCRLILFAVTLATGWVGGWASLLCARFLFGAGEAGCFPNLTKTFSAWFHGAERTRVQSRMWVAARWGGAFTPLVVVAVLDVA